MPDIAKRIEQMKRSIAEACARAGRDTDEVRVIIVTKIAPIEAVQEVIRLGYSDLGENRVQHLKQISDEIQEFLNRNRGQDGIPDQVRWHMIGHLQRNKVKAILKQVSSIHSLDTLRLAEEINTCAGKAGIRTDVLLQVNCSEEPQKYGAPVGAATHLAEQITTMPNLRLTGLMTMAPLTKDKNVVRSSFVRAREIFEEIRGEGFGGQDFSQLSMGMSQDYEIAIEEGATILRIGSAIFA